MLKQVWLAWGSDRNEEGGCHGEAKAIIAHAQAAERGADSQNTVTNENTAAVSEAVQL